MAIIWSNIIICIYLGKTEPLITKKSRILEHFNEFTVTVVTYHILFFTDWVGETEDHIWYGWLMIGVILINAIINLLIVIFGFLHRIKLVFIRNKNRIVHNFKVWRENYNLK